MKSPKPHRHCRARTIVSTAVLTGCLAAAVAPNTAAASPPASVTGTDVRLYVQAPWDFRESGQQFNLDRLELQNLHPVFADYFAVPYDELSTKILEALQGVAKRDFRYDLVCPTPLCPDSHVSVALNPSFSFTQQAQPVVTQIGPASSNKLRVRLDTQARAGITVGVGVDTPIWDPSVTVDLHVLLGVHGEAELTLWPTLEAKIVETSLSYDGGNIELTGLKDALIKPGMVIGGTLGGVGGALVGAVLADLAVEMIEDKLNEKLDETLSAQLDNLSPELLNMAQQYVDPHVEQANDLNKSVMSTPIPGVGYSLEQLMALASMSLDVRTHSTEHSVRSVVTTRFDPEPAAKQLQGTLRLPKTQCTYSKPVGNEAVGQAFVPEEVVTVNAQLAGKACASAIPWAQLRPSAYLGESPEKLLDSGEPANDLPSWRAIGSISGQGSVTDMGDHYACSFTVSDLPASSILEFSVDQGSALDALLPFQRVNERMLFAQVGPVTVLLDAMGTPITPMALTFGGANPTHVDDCPTYSNNGTGALQLPDGSEYSDLFNVDKCPSCITELQGHLDALVRPGDWSFDAFEFVEHALRDVDARVGVQLDARAADRVRAVGLSRGRGAAARVPAAPERFTVKVGRRDVRHRNVRRREVRREVRRRRGR